jgi:hypothetical protein
MQTDNDDWSLVISSTTDTRSTICFNNPEELSRRCCSVAIRMTQIRLGSNVLYLGSNQINIATPQKTRAEYIRINISEYSLPL